jgi:hypothetical protein
MDVFSSKLPLRRLCPQFHRFRPENRAIPTQDYRNHGTQKSLKGSSRSRERKQCQIRSLDTYATTYEQTSCDAAWPPSLSAVTSRGVVSPKVRNSDRSNWWLRSSTPCFSGVSGDQGIRNSTVLMAAKMLEPRLCHDSIPRSCALNL